MTDLMTVEAKLGSCERVLERALISYAEAGAALKTIRDEGLYKGQYLTFEEYCRERWNWSRQQAYRQIDAAMVYETLATIEMSPTGDTPAEPPRNERAARELVPLRSKPAQLKKVWQRVIERYGPAAEAPQVRKVVAEVLPARRLEDVTDQKSVDDAVLALRRMTSRGYPIGVLRQALDAIDGEQRAAA